ncbi:MAG: hypothetical protein QG576_185 [Bacteroidota bacterium]|nr:hypothetical protein [Bacteroidota bacterium]
MNRNDFLRLIENSGPADRQMISEVSELITIFPYFQSAYMLLLKGLQNSADVKFENQLRSSAMHIADREVLYYFLKREKVSGIMAEIPDQEPVLKATDIADSQQTVIESAKNSQDLINEIEKDSGELVPGELRKDHSILVSSEDSADESDVSVLLIDDEADTIEDKIFYMDPGFSVPDKADLLELETEEGRSPNPERDAEEIDHQPESVAVTKKQLQSELIDKFIILNPRIEPVRDKTDKPVEDISKPFVEEGTGFVTETLARIYLRQGYYSKAIDIYGKLCLKFPEKSSYFASQIEKVKELIKK